MSGKSPRSIYCPMEKGETAGLVYVLNKRLGKGASATVWSAVEKFSGRKVAVKLFRAGSDYREMFDNEIDVIKHVASHAKLSPHKGAEFVFCTSSEVLTFAHLNTKIRSYSTIHPCYEMKLLGSSIADLLNDINAGLPLDTVKYLFSQILQALDFIHGAGIVHTDINTSNILFTHTSETLISLSEKLDNGEIDDQTMKDNMKVLLTDFGTSFRADSRMDEPTGTKEYCSPEQRLDSMKLSYPTDIWSAGCVLYEMLTDSMLFDFNDYDESASSESSDDEIIMEGGDNPSSYFTTGESTEEDGYEEDDEYLLTLQHLTMMEKLLGSAPECVIGAGRGYYDKHGNLNGVEKPASISIKNILIDSFEYSKSDAEKSEDMITRMIVFDPKDRSTASKLLQHEFMKM